MKLGRYLTLALVLGFVICMVAIGRPGAGPVGAYKKVSLVANTSGAMHRDKKMVNAWGMASLGGNDPFWINDEGSGVSELIDGKGNISQTLPFVTIPPRSGARGPSRPTGIVANTTNKFGMAMGGPALFIFSTIDGTIAGWNKGKRAVIVADNSGKAAYTGLAMAINAGSPFLYAANALGSVDVFDGSFNPIKTTGGFVDPNLPAGLAPYGIANIDGNLFVTYAQRSHVSGAVDEFDPSGNLMMRFATGGTLNQPWAVAMAPKNFGAFSNELLIGNFGDGTINGFNPATGEFLGQLADAGGHPLQISGLWALMAGTGVKGVTDPNAVYFTAGPNMEHNGLFGFVATAPSAKPTPTKGPTAMPSPAGSAQIVAKDNSANPTGFSFNPATLTVNKGQTVVFKNMSSAPHSIVWDTAGAPADQPIFGPGTSTTPVAMTSVGTFNYHCGVHGPSMNGKIIVKTATATPVLTPGGGGGY